MAMVVGEKPTMGRVGILSLTLLASTPTLALPRPGGGDAFGSLPERGGNKGYVV